jgi:hypothetical protein
LVIISSAQRTRPIAVALAAGFMAALVGSVAAVHYHRLGLTLSHYDARGHLIVARRIVDSITPGWQQIGAVWLPLPHLLNALPAQIDFFYRTGASGVAISVLSFAVTAGAIVWIVHAITGSIAASAAAALVFVLNPNVVYLQSTPMTEPLLLALTTAGVAALVNVARPFKGREGDRGGKMAALLLSLSCLTRYEAWPVTAAALALWMIAQIRNGESWPIAARRTMSIAISPAIALVAFAIFSRVVVGQWFVSRDFFVPENKALGDMAMAVREIGWGARMLSSAPLAWIGAAGLVAALLTGLWMPSRAHAMIPIALAATAALAFAAFYDGHPFRIRYMVPLIAAEAVGVGLAAGLVRRASVPLAVAATAITLATLRPLDRQAPMVVEAQWDRPNVAVRAEVTKCLGELPPGEKVMASMSSLGHYMQEASRSGLALRDFLHEGNGDIWLAAIQRPRPFAGWVLIEEKAEGGDMLARLAREQPHFLDGYSRVCEGAGLALYRRK